MALLAKQIGSLPGLNPVVMSACTGGGDTVAVDSEDTYVLFKNGDASSKTITIAVYGSVFGQALASVAHVVTAGNMALILLPVQAVDPTTGLVSITYSAVTSCTIAALRT